MKKILLIITVLTSFWVNAQLWDYEISLMQDVRMSYSNPVYEELYGGINDYRAFTLNTYIKAKLKSPSDGYAFYKPLPYYSYLGYEYAQLVKEYHRLSFGMGLYSSLNYVEFSGDVNIGMIIRKNRTFIPSLGGDFEIALVHPKGIKLLLLAQLSQRVDLYGLDYFDQYKPALFGGVAFTF